MWVPSSNTWRGLAMPVVSDSDNSVMPSFTKLRTTFSTISTGTVPMNGHPKEVEMAPDSVMPVLAAKSAQSAKPSTTLTGVLLRLARQCASLAETVSLALVSPASKARCTPFRFGTRARYSTPSTFGIARHRASVSAICGTALG